MMPIWLWNRRTLIFCSLILFLCIFLFLSGVTGQQNNMDKQASEVSYNSSEGWPPPFILLTVLAVLSIILDFVQLVSRYKPKQKDDYRHMEEGEHLLGRELQRKIDQLQEENTQLKKENEFLQTQRHKEPQEKIAQLKKENEQLVREKEFLQTQRHKVDVTLDADTTHPRLEISDNGMSVKDTGVIRNVPSKEKRFDSHTFVLAKEGYTCGRHYWEVEVGKRRSWSLGIARESVARKGTLTLSPKSGFWVVGFADGREYWAHTDPWTRLSVSGKLQKIGIFLDVPAKKLSFYNVHKKAALYTFTVGGDSSQEEKFFPFFSTGPAAAKPDDEPLKIVQGFDDDE